MPYRRREYIHMREYKPSLLVRLKRLWWRFLSWKSHPLERPQCWACKRTFAPQRCFLGWHTQCANTASCLYTQLFKDAEFRGLTPRNRG